ncbi:MAG: thioredoxin family protein [Deltaproteobacteria bacterium]|nr:thioredoxin family protein [Deltaproteobacteria bacterium]
MKAHGAIGWIEDNLPNALACAQQRKVPVVVDLWAPWCHTCLSMQTQVFTDASFEADAKKFVFAALDTDREENAAAVAKYPLSAWPTFYVIDPDGSVLARFVGAASIAQFHAFLESGARAHGNGAAGADAKLLAADRAMQKKDYETAGKELAAALAEAPETWVRRPDALVSLLDTKSRRKDHAGCVDFAEANLDRTGNAGSASDFAALAMSCVREMLEGAPKDRATEKARATKLRRRAVARWKALLADAAAPLTADDRSDAMLNLRETLEELDEKAEAKAVAEQQRTLLDEAAGKAKDPMAAMTYNWHRAEVYVYLGKPLEVVPALEKSATDLPREYDPAARLGWVYFKAGKLAEAATWTDKAVLLAYGPRKGRVLTQRADIAKKAGDAQAEKLFRQEVVKLWESLPAGQQQPEALAKAKEALAALDKPAAKN